MVSGARWLLMGSSAMLAHASSVCGAPRSWLFQVIVSDRIRCSLAPLHRRTGSSTEARTLCGNDNLLGLSYVVIIVGATLMGLDRRLEPLRHDPTVAAISAMLTMLPVIALPFIRPSGGPVQF
jgi:hypothetical protein